MSRATARWRPTPEQFMILEELYKRGVTNPNASQIWDISTHLSLYGEIQGKNVFYWFQNHKARDRQKLRKKFAKHHYLLQHPPRLNDHRVQGITMTSCNRRMCKDVREDRWMRRYGHDSMMMMTEVGPITPCYRNRPLETLELFPLTSSPTAHDQKSTASNLQFPPS